jgi:thimet oligopeptidase
MHQRLRNIGYYPAAAGAAALLVTLLLIAGCLQGSTPSGTPAQDNKTPAAPIPARYSPGEITRISDRAEQDASAALAAIAAVPPGQRTVNNTLLAFDRALSDYMDTTRPVALMGYVSPDPAVAAEGLKTELSSRSFITGAYTRRDVYEALIGQVPRTPDEARLYNVTIRKFEHNGLGLPDNRLSKVRSLRENLSAVEFQYISNLNNDNTTLEFTAAELSGVPAATIATFRKTPAGTYLVTLQYPDYSAVMVNAEKGETRRKMYAAYYNRQAGPNTALLEQAIDLRSQIARELGYATWADYQLDGRMAKSTGNVMAFLASLKEPLREKTGRELAELLVIKKGLDPNATAVSPWDIPYLQEIRKKQQYSYSDNEVREYFPMENALQGMFSIYGNLFGIRFDEMKGAPVWSPEVRLFRVSNLTDNRTVGYMHLDLYPRQGKDTWFLDLEIIKGREKNGSYTAPVVAIVGNFPSPKGDTPSLLTPYELGALFHEGGHMMHYLLTEAPYGTMSGSSVEQDFIETPSQTLEELIWDPLVMESISGHYTNTSQKIPPGLRDRVIAARSSSMGTEYSRQLANSLEDMLFHTADGPVNVTEVGYRTYEEIMGIPPLAGTHQPASFTHIMDKYDAGYYSYLWADVYAFNSADTFRRDGMTNQTTGMRFRKEILARGNMEDGDVLLKNFLGREPGTDALYRHIGIQVPPSGSGT